MRRLAAAVLFGVLVLGLALAPSGSARLHRRAKAHRPVARMHRPKVKAHPRRRSHRRPVSRKRRVSHQRSHARGPARPHRKVPAHRPKRPTVRPRRRPCRAGFRTGFRVRGNFLAFAVTSRRANERWGRLIVRVRRTNRAARFLRGVQTFSTVGARVRILRVTDADRDLRVGLDDARPGDRVRLSGYVVRPRARCAAPTRVRVRQVRVARPRVRR